MHQFTLLSAIILHLSPQCNNYGTMSIKKNDCTVEINEPVCRVKDGKAGKLQQRHFDGKTYQIKKTGKIPQHLP